MGYVYDWKKISINVLIIGFFILGTIGLRNYYNNNRLEDYNDSVIFFRMSFVYSLPYILSLIYIFYTLRRSMMFKIILIKTILITTLIALANLVGHFETVDNYSLFHSELTNINLVFAVGIIIVAYITKEKILSLVYVFLVLGINILGKLNIISYILERNFRNDPTNFNNSNALINYYVIFQSIFIISIFIILLVIFNKYGIQYYQNKKEKDFQLNINA